MDADERKRREAKAMGLLDRATHLAGTTRARSPLREVDPDWSDQADRDDRGSASSADSSSSDEQIELAWQLIEWADVLIEETRGREAYPFLRAADAMPKGPKDDSEIVERVYRLAREIGPAGHAATYRKQLRKLAPERLAAIDKIPPPAATELVEVAELYTHPTFGVGTLVRREGRVLRIRFADGERAIVADRLVRTD